MVDESQNNSSDKNDEKANESVAQEHGRSSNEELRAGMGSKQSGSDSKISAQADCTFECKYKPDEKKPEPEQPLDNQNRKVLVDKYFSKSIFDKDFRYTVFTRLNAIGSLQKPIRFENVRFDHSIFDGCYIRDCIFDSCIFVGCKFNNSNFHSSKFVGCKFDYAIFEKTFIDPDLLNREAPWKENLKMRFARSLRMNFQQLGDAESVNRAISLELSATEQHLYKSWASSETYYVLKYPGIKKVGRFALWLKFRLLDFLWGNGESLTKLARTLILFIFGVAMIDTILYHDPYSLRDYFSSLLISPAVFFGVTNKTEYPPIYLSIITIARLTLFALFTAILVKRFSRR